MLISETIEPFKDYLDGTVGDGTAKAYKKAISRFLAVVGDIDLESQPQSLCMNNFYHYKAHMVRKGNSSSYIAGDLSALASYLDFLRKSYKLKPVDIMDVQDMRPKITQRIPDALEPEQQEELLEAATDIQNKMLIEVLLYSGTRIEEILALEKKHVTEGSIEIEGEGPQQTLIIKVMGKGKKERLIPLIPSVAEHLKTYMAHLDKINHLKEWNRIFDISYPTAWRRVKAAGEAIGIKLHPHVLRHSFGTNLTNLKVDLRTIADLMGHSSLETTKRYTKVKMETKGSAVSKLIKIPRLAVDTEQVL